jgi:hypothetical protein
MPVSPKWFLSPKFPQQNQRERDHLKDPDVDGRIIDCSFTYIITIEMSKLENYSSPNKTVWILQSAQ